MFNLEGLREVKFSISFKLGHMRPTAVHQTAGDVLLFSLIDWSKSPYHRTKLYLL